MDSDAMQAPVQDIIEKINNAQSAAVVSWAQSGITDIECKRRMGEFVDSIYAELQAFQKKQEAEVDAGGQRRFLLRALYRLRRRSPRRSRRQRLAVRRRERELKK